MKEYRSRLSVEANRKGVLDLDTVKGCTSGIARYPRGCYGLCYARKIAEFYGFDFSKSVSRRATPEELLKIRTKITTAPEQFVRIGTMGDPCHDWDWMIEVIDSIRGVKPIVIVTKHWIELTDDQMRELGEMGAILNTSISPLDKLEERVHRLAQYNRYKRFGNSVLRIVSCDFNRDHRIGRIYADIQGRLFTNSNIIDNPLRVNQNYPLLKQGIIRATPVWDLNSRSLISRFDRTTYIGKCSRCPELCGINMT